jgi:hypothetical protein
LTPIPPEKGFCKGIGDLFPPEDDNWWDGKFTHFDFDSLFKQIVERVPLTMANESFQQSKWVLKSSNPAPQRWNEYASVAIRFFSDYFLEFLQQGKGQKLSQWLETYNIYRP